MSDGLENETLGELAKRFVELRAEILSRIYLVFHEDNDTHTIAEVAEELCNPDSVHWKDIGVSGNSQEDRDMSAISSAGAHFGAWT